MTQETKKPSTLERDAQGEQYPWEDTIEYEEWRAEMDYLLDKVDRWHFKMVHELFLSESGENLLKRLRHACCELSQHLQHYSKFRDREGLIAFLQHAEEVYHKKK